VSGTSFLRGWIPSGRSSFLHRNSQNRSIGKTPRAIPRVHSNCFAGRTAGFAGPAPSWNKEQRAARVSASLGCRNFWLQLGRLSEHCHLADAVSSDPPMIVQQCGTGLPGRSVLALPVRPEKKFIHIHRERGSSVRATPAVLQEDTPVDLPGPWIVHWRDLRERGYPSDGRS